jgi:putative acetyltransferase
VQKDLVIAPVDPHREDVAALLTQADAYLLERYPPEICHLDGADKLAACKATLLGAFLGSELAGMVAIKIHLDTENPGEHYGEVKRLFVTEKARGKNLGRRLMQALESHLLHQGIKLVRLETGTAQPEAVSLYERLGYCLRGPFGDYAANAMSIFMEKRLDGN